jgi:hypothetical protein
LVFVPPVNSAERGAYLSFPDDGYPILDSSWSSPPGATVDQTFLLRVPKLPVKGNWTVRVVLASPSPGAAEGALYGGGYSVVTPAEVPGLDFAGFLSVT